MTSDQRRDNNPSDVQADRDVAASLPSTLAQAAPASQFMRVLAHELRNHLAPIRNASHVLRLATSADPELSPMLDMIERQVAAIARTLEVIVGAERASRGAIALSLKELDLSLAVGEAIERAKPMFEGRSQRLHVSRPPQPVWVRADAAHIAQALDTLLDNASRYTDVGGDVWLDLARAAGGIHLRVRDSGCGISAAFLPRVFDYFAGRSQPIHGLGVGLAVARDLVEGQGGRILAASEGEGKGSEFVIELPDVHGDDGGGQQPANASRASDMLEGGAQAESSSPRPRGPSPCPTPAQQQRRRILIADDSAAVRDSLAGLLRDKGHEVRGAGDGEQALELAASWRPDFVLLDIHMPKLNGFKVARELRAKFPSTHMRLVMMSGNTLDEATLAGAKAAGFDTCIDKVFAFSDLDKLLSAQPPA